jgi:acyl-CoA synthetase (AMP-forming)/AMP-acid ligase II
MTTADYLFEASSAKQTAIVAGKTLVSYAELRHLSARALFELLQLGAGPGSRVGILASNSVFWVAAYLATLKLGAVAVPFPTTRTVDDVRTMQSVAHCGFVCAEERLVERFRAGFDDSLVVMTDAVLRMPGPSDWPSVMVERDADAALMFTSGTTAHPKAVRITHRNLQANTDSIVAYLNLAAGDRIFVLLPFDYCFGTSLLHTHLRSGGTVVLGGGFMYPEATLDLLEASGATGLAGVPTLYQTLLRRTTFAKRPLPALTKIQQAGGRLSSPLIQELAAAVPAAEVFVMYGQTEATARLSYLSPTLLESKLGSIGRGIPGVTLRVLDSAGAPVRPGAVGEIWAEGDNISPGYLDDPEATAAKFPGGRLRTGDLATVDADGFLFIHSRETDFIKTSGYRVGAQQIEDCVLELPQVVSAAAIGVEDPVLGEAIRVYVTVRDEASFDPKTVMTHCGHRLARYMIPRDVVVLARMPVNTNGKIDKGELRRCAA